MRISSQKIKLVAKNKKTILGMIAFCFLMIATVVLHKDASNFVSLVQPIFSGYDGNGQVTYNEKELNNQIQEYLFRKSGLSKKKAQGLIAGNAAIVADVRKNASDHQKFLQAVDAFHKVKIGFDKVSNLKNGEKLIFKIYSNATDLTIPTQEKVFMVTDLKSVKKISIADILAKHPVTFTGFNGSGKIQFDETVFDEPADNGTYSNNDSIHLSLCPSYLSELKNRGYVLKNSSSITVKVEGLKEFSQLSNLSEVIAKIDGFSKLEFKGYDLPWRRLLYSKSIVSHYYVPLRNEQDQETFLVMTIYEVTRTEYAPADDQSATTVFYKALGYRYIPCEDNKLDLSHLDHLKYYGSEQDTLELLLSDLKNKYTGLKEFN
jgi:hypothetical protein